MERIQEENIKLTIAVPVYNVEKYLRRCLDSLVSQDYKEKEILIVNDGSTDNSLEIIKEYAKKYNFIRYIDQQNAGLAAVRNTCISSARGEYISFIDSDDFVVKGLYSHLMPVVYANSADILCFGVINLYEKKENYRMVRNANSYKEEIKTFSTQEALDEFLLPNNIDVITCNKIIKTSLYEGIEYPVGKLYEDMFTNYKVIAKAKKIYSTNYKYYVYCHRESSIGGMKYSKKTMDLYRAVTEVYEYVKKTLEGESKNLNVGYAFWIVVILNIMIRSNYDNKEYRNYVVGFVKRHINEISSCSYLSKTRKIQMHLLIKSFKIYVFVYKLYLNRAR